MRRIFRDPLMGCSRVSTTCVIGLQWGDEAKGKLVHLLAEQHEIVVRYQGGANAGHTVVSGTETYKLSLVPSGILVPNVRCVITGGVVLHPPALLAEMDGLTARGVQIGENFMISDRAHVIFPWHLLEDRLLDSERGNGESIGTTQRGIGPCYRDKVGRNHAIRLGDLFRDNFPEQVERTVAAKRAALSGICSGEDLATLDVANIARDYQELGARLRPFAGDTTSYLLDATESGKRILCEGAQGALLDIDHGTFPYVTSSNSSGVGISNGSGIPGRWINKVLGVVKAYSTRVGGGPFPTEQDNDIGQQLRDRGNEYGTVTRRPRRCGWLDAVAIRYTARLSGVNSLAVMLLDVLSGLPELNICTSYELNGERTRNFPSQVEDLRRVTPVYETLPGWEEDISGVKARSSLPKNALAYLARIEELVGRPVEIISVGPERNQTIHG